MRARPLALLATIALPLMAAAPPSPRPLALAGTWVMEQAYEIRADGTRTTNYGEHPSGLMMVDPAGHYSIQVFRPGRPNFAAGVKAEGKPEEFRQAVLGSSTHFGRVHVDAGAHQLLFYVEAASFPNWEGKRQVRNYTYRDGVLSYAVPASASGGGTVSYSVWKRLR
jgi:Lipocalin-like domain